MDFSGILFGVKLAVNRTYTVQAAQGLTISRVNHSHLHPLQAANCCRNSRLVVDDDDLKWVKN